MIIELFTVDIYMLMMRVPQLLDTSLASTVGALAVRAGALHSNHAATVCKKKHDESKY